MTEDEAYRCAKISCFNDTLNISNSKLKYSTKKAIENTKVYQESFKSNILNSFKDSVKNIKDTIVVKVGTTFATAKDYLKYGKVAVLNFANPENPGGGVRNGAMAQEACLCRSSNLYVCLSDNKVFEDYYLFHRNLHNRFYSDRIIYSKEITVFKDDSDIPRLMPESEWFNVDVITCAAPYISGQNYTNKTALKEIFKGRIKNIFETAIDNDVDVLILGAFGCGAFKNPPEVVAKAFCEVIDENKYAGLFKKIVFAIKSNDTINSNFNAFYKEFFGKFWCTPLTFPKLPYLEIVNKRFDINSDLFLKYLGWKDKNKYSGKQFSILGDSISTLDGYNPKGYEVFYRGDNCQMSGVTNMTDTWWGKVIDFFGGELLVNNSWSGSRVTKHPNNQTLFPSGCSNERTGSLHINNTKPDVIIIYLGINDWANGVELDGTSVFADELDMKYFSFAYKTIIEKIKSNYPEAEIMCCTLNTTFMSSNPSFKFPHTYCGKHIEEYNRIIMNTANTYSCRVIDLYGYYLPYDTIDGTHPNAQGMNLLATMMIREIGGKEVDKFIDCENGQHQFSFMTYEYDQNYNGGYHVCEKCGRIKYESEETEVLDNKSPYIWNSLSMNTDNIDRLQVSFGNFPIVSISYDGEKLIVYNRINGSRDGWMSFPNGFFDDKIVNLTVEQKASIIEHIKKIDFSTWRTEYYIRENYERGATGFCINNSFAVTFKNGEFFKCYEPKYDEFEQLVGFLKSFCDNNWFEPYYEKKDGCENDSVLPEEIYDEDTEYIRLPSSGTRILFGDTIKLYDIDTNQNIEIRKSVLAVGKDTECNVKINDKNISDVHAVFYHKNATWFIMDNNSENGTWLNDRKLKPYKKYELYFDDVISFARSKCYVFFKSRKEKTENSNKSYFDETDLNSTSSNINIGVGTIIYGRYKLIKELSKRRDPKVYLAYDLQFRRQCAVKISKKIGSDISDCIAMNEAQMLKLLNHRAIPRIVDVIDSYGYFAFVMDYVEGETLETVVEKNGAQPVKLVVEWSKQICDVLQYLHSLTPPHIHRDVKPSNLVLEPTGNIRIIDFGIMRKYNPQKTGDTAPMGTLGYAAPEQCSGTPQSDARTDIFGLGMTMLYLLTGIAPKIYRPATDTSYQLKEIVPQEVKNIIDKCIQPNPDKRYQSCEELKSDLNNYLSLPKEKNFFNRFFRRKQ